MRGDLEHRSVGRLAATAAERYGDTPAIREGEATITYAQLGELALDAAAGFVAAGVAPGDRVAIWAQNSARWVVAALGALSAGAVLVPMNTRYRGDEAAYVLRRSGARLLVCAQGFLGADHLGMLAANDGPEVRAVTIGEAHTDATGWADFLGAGADRRDDAQRRLAEVGPDDLSDVMFTSGTTGRPKGAMLTHGQTLRVFDDWCDTVGLRQGDRYLIVNPFFHTFGYKAGIVGALLRGATLYPLAVFDAATVAELTQRERISVLPGAPTLFQSLLELPERDRLDLTSLRLAITGAAVVPVEMIRRMRSELGFTGVLTGYGLTETNGTATMCHLDDPPETIAESCGRAVPDTEVRVVGPDGAACAPGAAGGGRDPRLPRHARIPRRSGGHRGDDRRRRLAAHRRRRSARRARLPADHRPAQGHVHRRRVQRLPGGDRAGDDAAIQRWPRWRSSPRRTSAWARSASPSWCPVRAPRWTSPSCGSGAATRWPTTRCRASTSRSTPSR